MLNVKRDLLEIISSTFKHKMITTPNIAMYFGVDFDFKKTPQNIIKTPQMAESIIEFILITSFYFTHSNNCVTEPLVNSSIG